MNILGEDRRGSFATQYNERAEVDLNRIWVQFISKEYRCQWQQPGRSCYEGSARTKTDRFRVNRDEGKGRLYVQQRLYLIDIPRKRSWMHCSNNNIRRDNGLERSDARVNTRISYSLRPQSEHDDSLNHSVSCLEAPPQPQPLLPYRNSGYRVKVAVLFVHLQLPMVSPPPSFRLALPKRRLPRPTVGESSPTARAESSAVEASLRLSADRKSLLVNQTAQIEAARFNNKLRNKSRIRPGPGCRRQISSDPIGCGRSVLIWRTRRPVAFRSERPTPPRNPGSVAGRGPQPSRTW